MNVYFKHNETMRIKNRYSAELEEQLDGVIMIWAKNRSYEIAYCFFFVRIPIAIRRYEIKTVEQ